MYPDWVEKYRREDCIIKRRGNNYYLYEKRIFYDAIDKIPIEVMGECLGRISKEGFIPSKNRTKLHTISCYYEYGASHLIDTLCQDILYSLKVYFNHDAHLLYSIAKQLLISKASFDDLPYIYRNSYDFITYPGLDFSKSSLMDLLCRISCDRHSQYQFMQMYMNNQGYIIFLHKHQFNDIKIDVLYCFHHHSLVYFYVCDENTSMDDHIKNCLNDIVDDVIFLDHNNLNIPYIIPFFTDIKMNHDNSFTYQDRYIYYDIQSTKNHKLYIYDDPSNIIIKDGQQSFLALRTNTSITPLQLYTIYVNKKIIDDMIELSNDILDINESYLSCNQYEGMLFIHYLSIMMYQRIYNKLKNTDISVYEVMQNLKLISKQMINNQWTICNESEDFLEKIKDIIPEYFSIES